MKLFLITAFSNVYHQRVILCTEASVLGDNLDLRLGFHIQENLEENSDNIHPVVLTEAEMKAVIAYKNGDESSWVSVRTNTREDWQVLNGITILNLEFQEIKVGE